MSVGHDTGKLVTFGDGGSGGVGGMDGGQTVSQFINMFLELCTVEVCILGVLVFFSVFNRFVYHLLSFHTKNISL